jgi:hypothetical protein
MVRSDELRVTSDLSEANGDFVIQQILLEPQFVIPQRVESGVLSHRRIANLRRVTAMVAARARYRFLGTPT